MNCRARDMSWGQEMRRFSMMLIAIGFAICIAPLIPALLGLLVDSQALATYHWLLYYSVPAGVVCVSFGIVCLGVLKTLALIQGKSDG